MNQTLEELRAETMAQAFEIAAGMKQPYTIASFRAELRRMASEQRDAAKAARLTAKAVPQGEGCCACDPPTDNVDINNTCCHCAMPLRDVPASAVADQGGK